MFFKRTFQILLQNMTTVKNIREFMRFKTHDWRYYPLEFLPGTFQYMRFPGTIAK